MENICRLLCDFGPLKPWRSRYRFRTVTFLSDVVLWTVYLKQSPSFISLDLNTDPSYIYPVEEIISREFKTGFYTFYDYRSIRGKNCALLQQMSLPIPMEKLLPKTTIDFKAERARCPPLTRMLMSGEMSGAGTKELTAKQKFDRWWVGVLFLMLKSTNSS